VKKLKKAAILLAASLALTGCTRIEPGHVGIKVDLVGQRREVDTIEVVVGRVFYNPWTTQIVEFPYTAQRFEWWGDESLKFSSREGVRLAIDVAISLGVNPDFAPEIYVKYRKTLDQLIDNEIRDRVNGCMNRAAGAMGVEEIIGERRNVWLDTTLECINERLVGEGFILNDFQLTSDFAMSANIAARIEEQIQAQQAAIAAENRVREVEAQAAQARAAAAGERDSAILQAEGQAESMRIINEQLTQSPAYLQYLAVQRWNGVMPMVSGGDSNGVSFLMPLPGAPQLQEGSPLQEDAPESESRQP
jgi:regulator of protease activity HflC (stomatin/prohibitin superfamily)